MLPSLLSVAFFKLFSSTSVSFQSPGGIFLYLVPWWPSSLSFFVFGLLTAFLHPRDSLHLNMYIPPLVLVVPSLLSLDCPFIWKVVAKEVFDWQFL